jgi:hypothetical protein
MTRVHKPAIEVNIRAKPARLDKPLRRVVATLAKTHKWTEPEFVDVAVVRLDVIADCRRLDDAALGAEDAQRMFKKLVPPDPRPATCRVPPIPFRRLAANAHARTLSSAGRSTEHRSRFGAGSCNEIESFGQVAAAAVDADGSR